MPWQLLEGYPLETWRCHEPVDGVSLMGQTAGERQEE